MPHAVQIAHWRRWRLPPAARCRRCAQPLYLRNKVAYTQAERREMAATKEAGA
jgi:tRNA threonylcarbamoyladenosine biosynthesis protein TsaB